MTTFRGVAGHATKAATAALGAVPATSHHTARALGRVTAEASAVAVGVVGLVGASWVTLARQAQTASSVIEAAARAARSDGRLTADGQAIDWQHLPPSADGVYLPDGSGPCDHAPDGTRVLALMGDSTSVGYGCLVADELPAVALARGAAVELGVAVRVTGHGAGGSVSADLARQLIPALAETPDAVVILVGANDVTHRVAPHHAASQLASAVRVLREADIPVVVATCPDLGVIAPIPQPLRHMVGAWSRILAREQERAATAAGAVPVSLSRLVSPAFYGHPELFYADRYHPSGAGYAKAIAALMPVVIDALRPRTTAAPTTPAPAR